MIVVTFKCSTKGIETIYNSSKQKSNVYDLSNRPTYTICMEKNYTYYEDIVLETVVNSMCKLSEAEHNKELYTVEGLEHLELVYVILARRSDSEMNGLC